MKHGSSRTGKAASLLLVVALLVSCLLVRGSAEGSPGDYSTRRLLGIEIPEHPFWKQDGVEAWMPSFVPGRYQTEFRNVCLYVHWSEFETAPGKYNTGKYEQIINDLKDVGVESIKVSFSCSVPAHVCQAVYERLKPGNDFYDWVCSWANSDLWVDPKTGRYTNCKNWWSREVFDFDTQEGEFTQRIPKTVSKEDSEKGIPSCGSYWFYCMAPHLATVEYKKMVKIFMEEFGDDIDYVEPWDEAGWGLNTCAGGADVYQVVGGVQKKVWPRKELEQCQLGNVSAVRFSGWPAPTTFLDGTTVAGDYENVQRACYEAVDEAWEGSKDKDNKKKPYVLTSSLIGDNDILDYTKYPPEAFDGNLIGNHTDRIDFYQDNLEKASDEVAIKVESDRNVVIERPMYFDYGGQYRGGHVTAGTTQLSERWFFAEGTTRSGFDEYITVQNPHNRNATVYFNYYVEGGSEIIRAMEVVPPRSRRTYSVRDRVGPDKDVSLYLNTKDEEDTPVAVERPMYFDYQGRKGGHCVVGATSPSSEWHFAEGTCRPGFDTYFCIQNPQGADAEVKLTFMKGDGTTEEVTRVVGAKSRETVNARDVIGEGSNNAFDFSTTVTSTGVNGSGKVNVVVERPMYFDYGGTCRGGHDTVGAKEPREDWHFAEGTTRDGFDEYITILNPNDEDITAFFNYSVQGVSEPIRIPETVPAGSRKTFSARDHVDSGKDVGLHINSTNGPFVAERSIYFNLVRNDWPGNVYNGGSVCMGSSPGKKTYFAEGYLSRFSEEYITVMNPQEKDANVTVNMYWGDGGTTSESFQVPAESRITLHLNSMGMGLYKYCDAVSMHLFDRPDRWCGIYNNLRGYMDTHWLSGKELVVSSCGWPHGGPSEGPPETRYYNPCQDTGEYPYSYEGQARSVREDIKNLTDPRITRCNKVWVFRDIDPWETCDGFFGLFSYVTHEPFDVEPTEAWFEYVGLQNLVEDGKRWFPEY